MSISTDTVLRNVSGRVVLRQVSDEELTMTTIPATSSTIPGMKNKMARLRTNDFLTADLPSNTNYNLTDYGFKII